MQKICFYLPLLLSLFLMSCSKSKITEQDIEKIINNISKATEDKDTEKIVSYFDDNVKITLDMPPKMGGKISMGKKQYEETLSLSFFSMTSYNYEVKDKEIKIDPSGMKANVKSNVLEEVTANGILVNSETEQDMDLAIINGKILITKLYGKVKLK